MQLGDCLWQQLTVGRIIETMEPSETGLVVPVPSLEEFVTAWRSRVDAIAPVGVPAHVTVLYPFVAPADVEAHLDALHDFFAAWPPFVYSLDEVGWFNDEVVFIRPSPAEAFSSLTSALEQRWGLLAYGGEISEPEPHVTIGQGGAPANMKQVADAADSLLPIQEQMADRVWLMQGTPEPPRWAVTHEFHLGTNAT